MLALLHQLLWPIGAFVIGYQAHKQGWRRGWDSGYAHVERFPGTTNVSSYQLHELADALAQVDEWDEVEPMQSVGMSHEAHWRYQQLLEACRPLAKEG